VPLLSRARRLIRVWPEEERRIGQSLSTDPLTHFPSLYSPFSFPAAACFFLQGLGCCLGARKAPIFASYSIIIIIVIMGRVGLQPPNSKQTAEGIHQSAVLFSKFCPCLRACFQNFLWFFLLFARNCSRKMEKTVPFCLSFNNFKISSCK
jgi:hypothetical protein